MRPLRRPAAPAPGVRAQRQTTFRRNRRGARRMRSPPGIVAAPAAFVAAAIVAEPAKKTLRFIALLSKLCRHPQLVEGRSQRRCDLPRALLRGRFAARSKVDRTMSTPEMDPTQAASPSLNRRIFVGISAAAALGAPTVALSAPDAGGQTHPPLVPEDDPAISVEHVALKRDGAVIGGYAARPVHGAKQTPDRRRDHARLGRRYVDSRCRSAARQGRIRSDRARSLRALRRAERRRRHRLHDLSSVCAATRTHAIRRRHPRGGALAARNNFRERKRRSSGFCMGGRIALLASIDNAGDL